MEAYEIEHSALQVNKGIEQPPMLSDTAFLNIQRFKRKKYTTDEYVDAILKGNRTVLSQAITLAESTLVEHQQQAQEIIEKCLPYSGNSMRVGITGVPGVGKSTFIESLGMKLIRDGHKLAVLAIDPSSERTGGSILGDKTRMEELSGQENAFIRPSPSTGSLGGVASRTRETIILCEAAGFNHIIIETVGVGQSETLVHSMVDFFLLLMLAGAGDELQGIKRGIMEMADAIAITKADGDNKTKAELAQREYRNALHLFPPTESGWIPKVATCSSIANEGIEKVWGLVEQYFSHVRISGYLQHRRNEQAKHWMFETIDETLKSNFYYNKNRKSQIKDLEKMVLEGKLTSYMAAKTVLDQYFQGKEE